MTGTAVHEIYAIKFGQNDRGERGHFMMGDAANPHDVPMQLDYFVWAIRSPGQDIVLDAGFTTETNKTRARNHFENPTDALRRLGVDPATVPFVLLSHLHYDHAGDLDPFESARFVVQEAELAFWTGALAPRHEFARHVEVDDIVRIVELNYAGRVWVVDGTQEIVDGVWVVKLGGHTAGSQATVVRTAKGMVVLAADAAHFFENVEQDHPFAVLTDLPNMYRGYDRMKELAAPGLVIAGHDPQLFDRFERVPGLEDRALRIA